MTAPTEREQRYAEAVGKAAADLGVNDFWGSDSSAVAEAVMAVADAEQAELRADAEAMLERGEQWADRALAAEAKVARVEALVETWERESKERGPADQVYSGGVASMLRVALAS